MQYNSETPHEEYTVQGLTFLMPQPYAPGDHTLTEGEASQLNQVLAENLRNNFAQKVRNKLDDYRKANNLAEDAEVAVDNLDKDELDKEFEEYAKSYEFGVRAARSGTRTPVDPVGREAARIAWERIKAALSKKNIKLDSITKEKKTEFIEQAIAKYPEITEEARRRVEVTADIAVGDLDLVA